jgi:acylphosphatase
MTYRRFLVSGRVQGVFFRVSAAARANELGLSGRARNLANGQVEVIAFGDERALDEIEMWLHRGPPSSSVDSVSRETLRSDIAVDLPTGRFRVA